MNINCMSHISNFSESCVIIIIDVALKRDVNIPRISVFWHDISILFESLHKMNTLCQAQMRQSRYAPQVSAVLHLV